LKKLVMILTVIIMSIGVFAEVFAVLDIPQSIGAGYKDSNNYLKISNKDFSFSYRQTFFENIQPFVSFNFAMENPVQNNDINVGLDLIYDNFDFGIGLFNSFTETATTTDYAGYLGTNVFFNGNLSNLIFGANLSYRMMNVVNTDGLNYYFQAFPEDLAQLQAFNGYVGYEFFNTEEWDVRFYINFLGNYSVIPGGFIFYKFDQDYTFTLELTYIGF